jgi:hypothetical protein
MQNYRATLDIATIYLGYTNDLATTLLQNCQIRPIIK